MAPEEGRSHGPSGTKPRWVRKKGGRYAGGVDVQKRGETGESQPVFSGPDETRIIPLESGQRQAIAVLVM